MGAMRVGKKMMAGLLCLAAGCATGTQAKKDPSPEIRIAAALQTFSSRVESFRCDRREAARRRQALLFADEAQSAELSADTEQRMAVWKITGSARRQQSFDQLRAAAHAAGEAWSALETLRAEQKKAVDEADTKVKLDGKQLAEIVKALTALGTPEDFEQRAGSYVQFVLDARSSVDDQLAAQAAASAQQASDLRSHLQVEITQATAARLTETLVPEGPPATVAAPIGPSATVAPTPTVPVRRQVHPR